MKEQIIKILTELRPEFDFTQDVNFIEEGMLDSFDIVTLVNELEENFNILVDGMSIVPENFCTIDTIAELINNSKKKG